jgi:hypothetical protein
VDPLELGLGVFYIKTFTSHVDLAALIVIEGTLHPTARVQQILDTPIEANHLDLQYIVLVRPPRTLFLEALYVHTKSITC